MQPPAGNEKSVPYEGTPLAMRGGPSGIFVDFDLLPDLLGNASGARSETVAAWSALLTAAGFENEHLDADAVPDDQDEADRTAADAWRFAERMGLIGPDGPTADGRGAAALARLDRERTARSSLAAASRARGRQSARAGRHLHRRRAAPGGPEPR